MICKVAVASQNPVKIEAARLAFLKMFPGLHFDITGFSVPSEVSNQPIGEQETLKGALNRVKNLSKLNQADFFCWH